MDWAIGITALIASVLLWLFKPEPLRRWLRLQGPEDIRPHLLAGIDMKYIRNDPVLADSIRDAEAKGATFYAALSHQVGMQLQNGYEYFLTPDRRRCHYVSAFPSHSEEFFLLVKWR